MVTTYTQNNASIYMYVHLTNRDTVERFLTFLKLSTLQSLTMQARTLGQVSTPLDIDVLMVRG